MLEIEITNQKTLEHLQEDVIESVKIRQALQYSLLEGDILPTMVSRVIWQTQYDIARTWIDAVAGEEFQRLLQPWGNEFYDNIIKESVIRQLLFNTSLSVSQILLTPSTLFQKFTSRVGLMSTDSTTLTTPDQDRTIASRLLLPYHVWIALLKLLATHQELYKFISMSRTQINYLGGKLILENAQTKAEDFPIQIPSIAGGICYEGEEIGLRRRGTSDFDMDVVEVIYRGTEFNTSMLSHFSEYITTPEADQKVRNLIYDKYGSIVWKNRFGKKGNGKKEEDVPMMERKPIWQA